jgi:hypothetical protein
MSTKIGPIQTGEQKPAGFDFSKEGVSGSLTDPVVTIKVAAGSDDSPSDVLEGDPSINGLMVEQTVKYRKPGVLYLLQARAKDSAGNVHTVSAYLHSREVA